MPVRIQRRRTKGWRMPANTVNVTRPGPFGNPFKVGDFIEIDGKSIEIKTPLHAKTLFREHVIAFNLRLAQCCGSGEGIVWARAWVASVKALRGKNLACWCPVDDPCHGDDLLYLANAPEAA